MKIVVSFKRKRTRNWRIFINQIDYHTSKIGKITTIELQTINYANKKGDTEGVDANFQQTATKA